MKHDDFIEYIAKNLIETGRRASNLKKPVQRCTLDHVTNPECNHFPEKIPQQEGTRRKPSRPCVACNGTWADIRAKRIPKKCTGIWCLLCRKPLCVSPCFAIYHTDKDYKQTLLAMRFPTNPLQ